MSIDSWGQHSRKNGCSPCPWHPFQFIAWFFVLYFSVVYFTTIVPGLPTAWQPAGYVILAVGFIAHTILHIVSSVIDPADDNVKKSRKEGPLPQFDRTKHSHVIENMHCYICEVDVDPESKHCSRCNKCIVNFDHHCLWLNNCVGSKNYRVFIATLGTALIGSLIIIALCIMQISVYYIYKDDVENGADLLQQFQESKNKTGDIFQVLYQDVIDEGWISLVAITGLLALVAAGLLGHLLSFHIYLMCRGLSTYEYIVKQRDAEEKRAREKEIDMEMSDQDPGDTGCVAGKNSKTKVAPLRLNSDLEKGQSKQNKNTNNVERFGASSSDSGGVLADYERALAEQDLSAGETPPPATTPLPLSKKKKKKNKHGSSGEEKDKKAKKKRRKKQKSDYLDVSEDTSTSYYSDDRPHRRKDVTPRSHRSNYSKLDSDRSQKHSHKSKRSQHSKKKSSRLSPSSNSASSLDESKNYQKFTSDLNSNLRYNYETGLNESRSSRLEVQFAPVTVHTSPRIEIKPSTPALAVDYNSESAESLQEIPLETTMAGSRFGSSPRVTNSNQQNGYQSQHKNQKQYRNKQKRSDSDSDSGHDEVDLGRTTSFRLNKSAKVNKDGSIDYTDSFKTKTMPITPQGRRKHHNVPPLDLTEITGDEDDVIT